MSKLKWGDKYIPKTLDEMVLDSHTKTILNNYLVNKDVPDISFIGIQGIGKTTLAMMLANEVTPFVLYINASSDNGIDMVRTKITDFIETDTGDKLKVVVLDEASGLTRQAQESLKATMDSQKDVRYILTANHSMSIVNALLSRCKPLTLSFAPKDVLLRLISILKSEQIPYDKEVVTSIFENIVKKNFPDIRKSIGILEMCCSGKKYEYQETTPENNEVVDYIMSNINDVTKCREFWLKNETMFENDYTKLARMLFEKFTDKPEKMLIIGNYMYRMSVVLDREVQFACMIMELK